MITEVSHCKTPQLERKGEKQRERGRKRDKVSQRFSPHVEIQYIFYRALSLQKGENLSTFEFLSLPLPLPSFSLTEVSCCSIPQQNELLNRVLVKDRTGK
jgi:hypothetical protein